MSDIRADGFGNEAREESYSVKSGEEAISNKGINFDRLSSLPDDILIHILSRLGFNNVKHAAITCVLSKRWNFLWTEMPRLNFCDCSRNPNPGKTQDFVSRVHRTIISRSRSYVDQFSVEFLYNECFALDVNAWIRFALKNKVKDLSVRLNSVSYFYTPPLLLYSDTSLTRMSLQMCILAPPRKIEWPHLTHLKVEDVELPQDVIEKILSGSPVLCNLCIILCWGFNNISSESLRELEVWDTDYRNNVDLLEISTPYLSSLDITFSPFEKKIQLTASSIDRAKFCYTEMDVSVETMNGTKELLEKTQHANQLVLQGLFVEVLSVMVMNGWQLPQSKRVWLELESSRHEFIIPGILSMLKSSPNLQNLLIECEYPYEESEALWGQSPRNDLDCDLFNLKTVRLQHMADPVFDGEPMLTMARILLKRATTLEMMVIKLEDVDGFSPDFGKMSETVHSYQRSSEKAVVVIPLSTDEDN